MSAKILQANLRQNAGSQQKTPQDEKSVDFFERDDIKALLAAMSGPAYAKQGRDPNKADFLDQTNGGSVLGGR